MTSKPTFRPLSKTVVTEIKQFVVDSVRRTGAMFQTVSTKISRAQMEQLDVVVERDKPYTLHNVQNIVSLSTPHPVEIELLGFGTIPEEEPRSEQIFFDAEVLVERADAGRFVNVRVIDKDIYSTSPLSATALNMRTGETETFQLPYSGTQGVFDGFFQTQNNPVKGTDFDGVMYCQKDDTLRVIYVEPNSAAGTSRDVIDEVVVTLDFKETALVAPDSVPFNKSLNVRVLNPASRDVVIKNLRSGHTITQLVGAIQPIDMAFEDTDTSMSVQDFDQIEISTQGKDIYGQLITVQKTLSILPDPVDPVINVASQVDLSRPFTVTVQDFNLPANAELTLRNTSNNQYVTIPLIEDYPNAGRYSVEVFNVFDVVLPGELLRIQYTNSEVAKTIVRDVNTIMPQTPECQEQMQAPDTAGVSAPVVIRVNGLFVLNGSFAGTIKIRAISDPVRCTLLKA